MRAVGDQHLITTLAAAAVVGLDHAQAGPLAMRTRSRLPGAWAVLAPELEEQGLAHASASRYCSMARGWLSSATETSKACDSSGKARPNGRPASTPRSSMKLCVCSAGYGVRSTNSHRNGAANASRYALRSTS